MDSNIGLFDDLANLGIGATGMVRLNRAMIFCKKLTEEMGGMRMQWCGRKEKRKKQEKQ